MSAQMSGHFYKVGFFNWNAKGNKKGKKGKRGKKGGFLALFAFFVVRPAGRVHLEVKVLYEPGRGNR
jgi:hypothetical protein